MDVMQIEKEVLKLKRETSRLPKRNALYVMSVLLTFGTFLIIAFML